MKYSFPANATFQQLYEPATQITDGGEAAEYWRSLVSYLRLQNSMTLREAMELARKNIGYYAGYYDRETQQRVWSLFQTEHPVFGRRIPTPEEALAAGMRMALENQVTPENPET